MRFDFAVTNAVILSSHNGYIPFVGSVAVLGEELAYVGEKAHGIC